MRRLMTFFRLPLCLAACALGLASCDETQEASAYDNWQARNEAFVDSLRTVAGDNFLTWQNPPTRAITDIGTDGMELGKLYALLVQDGGNTGGQQYVYCKKLVDNPDGERVLYTDQVSIYYYGTLINNVSFDGNFDGWGATDVLESEDFTGRWYTDFDEPATFALTGIVSGFTWVLQHCRTGERWMVYIPWQSGYGSSDSNGIPGYSTLAFDFIVDSIVTE